MGNTVSYVAQPGDLIFTFSSPGPILKTIRRFLGKNDITRISNISIYIGNGKVGEHSAFLSGKVLLQKIDRVLGRDRTATIGHVTVPLKVQAVITLVEIDKTDTSCRWLDRLIAWIRDAWLHLSSRHTTLAALDARWITRLYRVAGTDLVPNKPIDQIVPVDLIFSPIIELHDRFTA